MPSIPARAAATRLATLAVAAVIAAAPASPPAASAQVSIAGVHWYSGDSAMLDSTVPVGQRGWNVETIINVDSCTSPDNNPENARVWAQRAKDHGLVNVIRVDYRSLQAVPKISSEYTGWSNNFIACINDLAGVASIFAVGNEPNIEGNVTAAQYAAAFNHLWGRKSQMPAGTQLLAVHNSPFTDPAWTQQMTTQLNGMDGFAFHTGGARPGCTDPRQPCSFGGWSFDGAFRYYRDVIERIDSRFWAKPVYLTEINTFTGNAGSEPAFNYPANWINLAYEDVRNYNANRGNRPPVVAVCWFVDENRSNWGNWALRNLAGPRTDQGEEFKNPANRGGSPPPTCPTGTLAVPSDRWRLEIWNNRTFTGNPVERRYDAPGSGGFSFNWGTGRASNCTGNDNFAIRFVRTASFPTTATYTFTTTTDDGVRLYIDGVLVLDRWFDQAPTTYQVARTLSAGSHTIRMDYYENGGGATAALSWSGGGGGGNNASVLEGQSLVPGSWSGGQTQQVRIRVQNTGGTTWTSGTNYRLGAAPNNTVNWSGFPCDGYNLGVTNQRVFICSTQSVGSGGTYDFVFNVTAPSSGTGTLAVRMVRDGFEWFGETQTWSIPVGGGGSPYPSCPCNRPDNYCQHPPSTSGCPMTFPFGYCDPNGDGSYTDGDWVRGYNEYQNYC